MKLRALALAAALTVTSGLAQASTYAVSYNTVDNFDINFGGGAGSLTPFTFSTSVAVQDSSEANFALQDAPAACVGCTFDNDFVSHPAVGEYAYGDAKIVSTNVLNNQGAASSIGEISAGSAGFASGSNSMTASFTVASPGTVAFAFSAHPYMQVLGEGSATTNMTITIFDARSLEVFSWAPNGVVGSGIITGGTERSDGLDLNLGIAPGVTYNPGTGSFAAITDSLETGTYRLNISMANQVTAVPEPETWAMLLVGMGLVGLRARQKAKAEREAALA